MSALAGRWNFDGRPGASRDCERILAAQAIYGPHDVAQWDDGVRAFGRRLFRTLPEDIRDKQPLTGDGEQIVMVADVRLDNRGDLVRELGLSSTAAASMADSTLLFAAWERWAEGVVQHLVGAFAFAAWDARRQVLFLVRDPLGARPLHFHCGTASFTFASMPKGLLALAEIPRAPDQNKVAEYLALLPEHGPASFFAGVERVEPGFVVKVSCSGVTRHRYWEPSDKTLRLSSAEHYAEGMLHHLDQAVQSQLRGAGNNVGTHLSSGFDSSAVTSSAAIQMARHNGRVIAFTSVPRPGYDGVAPAGRHGDEGPLAALTAARYTNIDHVLVHGDGRSPVDMLDRNFFLFDQPVLNLCNLTWATAIHEQAQARKLGVLLSGQMGNMTISYGGETLLPKLIRQGRWIRWSREAAGLWQNGHFSMRGILSRSFGPYVPAWFWIWVQKAVNGHDNSVDNYSAIRPDVFAGLDLRATAAERGLDTVYRPQDDSFKSRLGVLRRVDIGNMHKGYLAGWGIDLRDPTADRRLVEYCLALPEDQVLRDGMPKAVSRLAFANRLPPAVINSHSKGYQAVDWHEGLTDARPQLLEEVERLEACGAAASSLEIARLKQLLDQWPDGGWHTSRIVYPYRLALLRGISTGHFVRRAAGSNG